NDSDLAMATFFGACIYGSSLYTSVQQGPKTQNR
ncbi:MAG: hypothetical protein ACI956_000211, partial [Nonlabens sp.]